MNLIHSSSRFSIDQGATGWMYDDARPRTPEQRLMLAMLERAIRDFIGGSRTEMRDAESWLLAPDRGREADLFSFAWVCRELGLEHEQVLSRLQLTLEMAKGGTLPFFLDKRFMDRRRSGDTTLAGRLNRSAPSRIRSLREHRAHTRKRESH